MKRHGVVSFGAQGETWDMCPDPEGEWVRWEDVRELLADKARLDWFEGQHTNIFVGECVHDLVCLAGETVREAMDRYRVRPTFKGKQIIWDDEGEKEDK